MSTTNKSRLGFVDEFGKNIFKPISNNLLDAFVYRIVISNRPEIITSRMIRIIRHKSKDIVVYLLKNITRIKEMFNGLNDIM